jgi:hypothetical protein
VAHRDTTRRLPRTEEGVVDGIGEREEQETAIRAKRRLPDDRGGCRGGRGGHRYSRLSRLEAAAPADPRGLTLELDAAASSGTAGATSSAPPTATASSRMMWRPPSLPDRGGSDLEDGEGSTVRSRPAPREAEEEAGTGREDEEEAHQH